MSTTDRPLELLLVCFDGYKRAASVHHSLGEKIKADGGDVLSTTVLRVSAKGRARVYSPRRTLAGTMTPAVTWGVFGLLTSATLTSLVVWALLGALLGGLYAYFAEHLLDKNDLARLGDHMEPDSSAILSYVVGVDSADLTDAAATFGASPISVATISAGLSVTVEHATSADAVGEVLLSMLLLRYPGSDTAKTVYEAAKEDKSTDAPVIEVGSLIRADPSGRLHVVSPTAGSLAFAKPDVVTWAGFGLIFGLIAGFGGGGDLFGALDDGLETAIAWGIFGAAAGGLYGLFAGRAVSARRLKAVGPLLPPNSSLIVAWPPGAPTPDALNPWSMDGSEELVLGFVRSPPSIALRA